LADKKVYFIKQVDFLYIFNYSVRFIILLTTIFIVHTVNLGDCVV